MIAPPHVSSLYDIAKQFTARKYLVIPSQFVALEVKNNEIEKDAPKKFKKKPKIKWSEKERNRNQLLSKSDMIYWFGKSIPERGDNCRADGIGFALKGADAYAEVEAEQGPLDIAMDTDGVEATQEYEQEFLPRCPAEIHDAHKKTTLTITPSKGKHWLFGIKTHKDFFPDGLEQSADWNDIRIELPNNSHSQINLLGTNHMLNEFFPGYQHIRGIECKVNVSTEAIIQYCKLLTEFKKETSIITTIGNFIKPFYADGQRDEIIFATSGYLWKYGQVPINLAIRLFKHIMRVTSYSDEDWDKTIDTIRKTYANDPESDDVSGIERMLAAFNQQESLLKEISQGFKQINPSFFPEEAFDGFNGRSFNGRSTKNITTSTSRRRQKDQNQKQNKSPEEGPPEPIKVYEFVQFYNDDNTYAEAVTIGNSTIGAQRFAVVNKETNNISLIREISIDTEWDDISKVTKQKVYYPLQSSEYMHKPYTFESEEDFNSIVKFVKNHKMCTLDGVYQTVKRIWSTYIDAEEEHLIICAADTIFTYFQDVIGLTHYLWFVGDNDSGKSNNLWVLHYLAYRNMMSLGISAANVYQFLGSGEEGIGTICEDEANQLDEEKDKIELAKSGYTKGFPVVKITTSNDGKRHQKRYNTFCFKAYSAERAPSFIKAKGLLQRLIKLRCVAGEPSIDILEVVNPAGDDEMLDLLKELNGVRNLLLCYRLEHKRDKMPNVRLVLKNREKQLFKPLARLFQGTEAIKEIQRTIIKYIQERRKTKLSGLHAFLSKLIQDMMVDAGYNCLDVSTSDKFVVPTKDIWTKITTRTNGAYIPGHPLSFDTEEFGIISQKLIADILEDIFKAEIKSSGSVRYVYFTKENLNKVINSYELVDVDALDPEEDAQIKAEKKAGSGSKD